MTAEAGAPTVAVVGIGRMGGAMAARLARSGFPVTVYNRTVQRATRLASDVGATVAQTAREAASGADVVIVSLADDAAVTMVYSGVDGLVAGLRPGAVVLESSTIAPATVRAMGTLVAGRAAVLLDAPVSGSVPAVEQGELTFLVGGRADGLERAAPVVHALAARVFHLGALGAGATMKLSVNSVVHALNLALAEALVLAEKAGVDRVRAYDVFAASAVAAPYVHYKRDSFIQPGQTPVAFALDLVAKDLGLIDDLAHQVGARMEQLATTRRVVRQAVASGYGGHDLSALAELLRADGAAAEPSAR